jgi:Bacterial Ig-like domain (group 3)
MLRGIASRLVLATVMIAAFGSAFATAADQCNANSAPDSAIPNASNTAPTINGKVGYLVQLAGPNTPAVNLALDWSFIQEPDGSQSQIFESGTPNAYFIPDEQGIYMVEGTGNQGTVSETITVGPDRTLTPLEVRHLTAGSYNIVVGGVAYPGPAPATGAGTNVVLLDRSTLAVVDHKTFTDIGIRSYLQNVLGDNSDVLAIISSNDAGPGFALEQIALELQKFGANDDFNLNAAFPFAFIGIKNSSKGQAFQVGFSSVNLIGYLAPDASSKYAFIQTDYKTFEINPSKTLDTPSTVMIDGKTVLSSNAEGCAGGGLLLGILDRATLEPIFSQSYCTLAGSPHDSIAAQRALSEKLEAEARPESPLGGGGHLGDMIFLVGFGQIHNGTSPGAPDFSRLAYYINFAGGTYEAIYNVNFGDTYSLITSPDPDFTPWEAGSRIKMGSSSSQEGVLARTHLGNRYAPMGSTAIISDTSTPNLGLYDILARPPEDFPIPAPGDMEQQDAFAYISQYLCKCPNVRHNYENLSIDLTIYFTKLSNLVTDPRNSDSPSCAANPMPDTPFCQVRRQVLTELEYASAVRSLATNVTLLWIAENSNVSLILPSVTSKVNEAIKLDPNKMVHPLIEGLIGGFLSAVRVIPPPNGQVLGVLHGMFTAAVGIANNESGNNSSLDVNVAAAGLACQAAANFALQLIATGVIFNSIYEDWGKLQALGTALNSGNEEWKWTGVTFGQAVKAFSLATEQAAYQSLMAGRFWTRYYNAQNASDIDPWDYKYVWAILPERIKSIFSDATPSVNYLSSPSSRTRNSSDKAGYSDILTVSLSGAKPSGAGTQYNTPTAALINHLLTSVDSGGLGIWKPEIIRHWLPTHWCGPEGDLYQGNPPPSRGVSGCDYSKAQLPLLDLGGLTAISLSSSSNPSKKGDTVTFIAQVVSENGHTLTGNVQFAVDGDVIGSVDLINEQAFITTSALPAGDDTVVATYLGDVDHQGASSEPLIQTVKAD